jgi:hypothetical protein
VPVDWLQECHSAKATSFVVGRWSALAGLNEVVCRRTLVAVESVGVRFLWLERQQRVEAV